ncbi:MAG: glycosyltransferase family 2 protein [Candidatus Woesebacteria bacterium]|nr:MAG: glycosyltransferase family 2 protein [Candidatus Woesebacteria bacterium]
MTATKPELSVIILNYNTKELLEDCLNSVKSHMHEVPMEVIVSDNSSTDGGPEMIKKKFPWVTLIEGPNNGFSAGNNRAKPLVRGDMVLFLNPDTIVHDNVFGLTVRYLKEHPKVGAVTCKLVLPDGSMDKDVRRRFPTPWISFNRLVLGKTREYYYEYIPDTSTHEVEAIQGAFFLSWKKILDKVGWYDEGYFFDGEDVDLCYQISKLGYKLVYYPDVYITHLKGVTKGKVAKWKYKVTREQRKKLRMSGVASMERFFRKNLWKRYPVWFDYFVLLGINLFKIVRYVRVAILSSY